MNPIAILHDTDADGFAAAFSAWLKLGSTADYLPCPHGEPWPPVSGRELVYCLDFCPDERSLRRIAEKSGRIIIIDHHASASGMASTIAAQQASMQTVPLSKGGVAYIDSCDAKKVSGMSWSRAVRGGVMAALPAVNKKSRHVYMHRLILDAPPGTLVDHINRITTDNRRSNIRFSTKKFNAANMDRGSKYKGVAKSKKRWQAGIMVDGKRIYLGLYVTPEEAARAYDEAALRYFGEYARCNFRFHGPFPPNITFVYDPTRAACDLAWQHFHPNEQAPWLIQYIADRDLWAWKLPFSREVNAGLYIQPRTFEAWAELAALRTYPTSLVVEGAAVLAAQQKQVDHLLKHVREVTLDGHCVLACNTPVLQSEVAGALAKDRPFGVCWWDDGQKVRFSLRSTSAGVDVCAIAVRRGGGGHRQAAGFEAPPGTAAGILGR